MFNKYYQDELAYLRELGREFAAARPDAARFLGEAGSDPDVERLLEGFAFLTGRVRQKLDDELPELTNSMMELFFPEFLRPLPPMAILQAQPREGIEVEELPRGSYLDSGPIDGTRCRFRTTSHLTPVPARVTDVQFSAAKPPTLTVRIEALPSESLSRPVGKAADADAEAGRDLDTDGGRPWRFYLAGDDALTRALFVCLVAWTERVRVGGTERAGARVVAAGLDANSGMLPSPGGAFGGFRLLQEYFSFPARYMFVDVHGLCLGGPEAEIEFEFRTVPENMPPVTSHCLQLNCVPIVNLFEHDADPIRVVAERSEYKIRPGGSELGHVEIYSVRSVTGRERGSAELCTFESFNSFKRGAVGGRFYDVRTIDSVSHQGVDHMLSVGGDESRAPVDTLSIELLCSNRRLADRVGLGDVREPASTTSLAFTYRNVTRPTSTVAAPEGQDVHWRLLANLSLNYLSLLDAEALRMLLRLYDFRAREDRQALRRLENRMAAIQAVAGQRSTKMSEGAPLRGIDVSLRIDEEEFGGEGETYLFGIVLNEFLAEYVTMNSFTCLQIEIVRRGDVFRWPARLGGEVVL